MLNKRAVEEVCHNLNYRHKQAQYCGRASVLLNTHLFFKDKVEELEGFGGWAAI
jgi:exosome complex exonuclease DIS3/RRP44